MMKDVRLTSEQLASYWNAFLFDEVVFFQKILQFNFNVEDILIDKL